MSWLIDGRRVKALSQRHNISMEEVDVLLQTLGHTRGSLNPRWNHFVAVGSDLPVAGDLALRGLFEKKAEMADGSQVYAATKAGSILAARMVVEVRLHEARNGGTTKWHDRYRRYLQEGPETSFGVWWNAENARRSREGQTAPVFGVAPEPDTGMALDKTDTMDEKEIRNQEREIEPWIELG